MDPFNIQITSSLKIGRGDRNQQTPELQATVLVECEVKRFWSYSNTFIVIGWVVNKREARDKRGGNAVTEHM